MRLVSFGPRGEERPGVLVGDSVLDLRAVSGGFGASWRVFLDKESLQEVARISTDPPAGSLQRLSDVRLGPPIPDPTKIICVGLNYIDHAAEQGKDVPKRPMLFSKAPSALAGAADEIVIPEGITHVDYEAELAFVIGKEGRRIPEERAAEHVAGFMVMNDVSARKLQKDEIQYFRAKSSDTFAPCGPALVTPDEVPDPGVLAIGLELNGKVRQASNTRNLAFGIPFLVSYLSATMTLVPGDIISTGTPGGVGVYAEPKVFLRQGDELVTRVERLGELRNRVVEEAAA